MSVLEMEVGRKGEEKEASCQLSVVSYQTEASRHSPFAIRYTPEGGGEVETSRKCGSLDFAPDGRCARDDKSREESGTGETESPHIPKEGKCGTPTSVVIPQGLKPESEAGQAGTAEAVPLQSAESDCEAGKAVPLQTSGILSEAKVKELEDFWTKEPKKAAAKTAKEKKLARERKQLAKYIELLDSMGRTMDVGERLFSIREKGRMRKVGGREYLMEYVLKIRNKNGRLQALHVNAAQRDFAQTAGKRSIVLKARQLGITTYVAARFFLNCITRPGTLCVQVAHDQRSAEEIFRIVHRMLANLPEYLRKGVLKTSQANKRKIVFPHIDSTYMVETANENAGRGLTIQCLHCSEVSRWPGDAAATLAALRAAVPPDGEIVLESTANGACGCFYEEWQRAEEKGYTRHFYPWWFEPNYKRNVEIVEFTEEELELMAKYNLTAEQIGFRREAKSELGNRAAEEYAEDAEACFRASGECMFDVEAVEKRLHDPLPVIDNEDNGRLLVYLPPQEGKQYIIGVDPAGGHADGDYSCAQVIERASGMQCAELRGHLDRQETAARAAMLARRYNNAQVAVERNNHGHEVLAALSLEYSDVWLYAQKNQAGWLTTSASRPRMLQNLAAVLAAAPHLFNSTRLLEECKTFVRRPDSTTGAANGAHDDTVMAMAIALAVRAEKAGEASLARAVEVGVL